MADSRSEDVYAELVEAVLDQRRRRHGEEDLIAQWTRRAPLFRFDPHRRFESNLEVLASFVSPSDHVLEVGGGAGRVCLPLALRCQHATNVEPSPAMAEQFLASASEANIRNITVVPEEWLNAGSLQAEVVIAADVTYFVADIGPFVRKLDVAAQRRVMIWIWSVPPPNRHATLFELVHEEALAPVPGHRELLPVLWDMGLLPDVLMLPERFSWPETLPRTRTEAIRFAREQVQGRAQPDVEERLEANFDRLFERQGERYAPRWRPDAAGMLITWEPAKSL